LSKKPFFENHVCNLVELLRLRARSSPEKLAYIFLNGKLEEAEQLTYNELDSRARTIAAQLQRRGPSGERVLLLYRPGLAFIEAFFGALYAGWIAVPAYPPAGNRNISKIQTIVEDASPRVVLTNSQLLNQIKTWFDASGKNIEVLASDAFATTSQEKWALPVLSGVELALLQYTSGSISTPKGVMVSHKNLLHNEETIRIAFSQSSSSVTVSWLPVYHDMGLIGGVLQPLYTGSRCILMSPLTFLQSPRAWLETISRYRATTSGGPNFAYDLCSRRITESECPGLDLASWSVAFNGSEPIHAKTIERFSEKFAFIGFRREAFYSCYGLAEATLFVTGGSVADAPVVEKVSAASLQKNRARKPKNDDDAIELVSSGRPRGDHVVIVKPRTRKVCSPGEIGEIWIHGNGVAQGYWMQQKSTKAMFRARLANDPNAGPYLRTGDLGFFQDGELFITGRSKELVIIRGRNYYPHDLELTAEETEPELKAHSTAAFAVTRDDQELLVIVSEMSRPGKAQFTEIADAIRRAISETHEITVSEVVLVGPGGVPKTSSGKIRRLACRDAYIKNALSVLFRSRLERDISGTQQQMPKPALSRESLQGLAFEQRRTVLLDALSNEIAKSVGAARTEIDCTAPLASLGIDSLAAVQLSHILEKGLQVTLTIKEFTGASIEQLAAMLAERTDAERGTRLSPIEIPAQTESLPLSYGQRALWFLHRLAPESSAYNIAVAVRVLSGLDVLALQRALSLLVQRHAALRTEFSESAGEPVQRIHQEAYFEFREHAAESLSETEFAADLERAAARPFTLRERSLLRVGVYHRENRQSGILLAVHHIISDFWSMAIIGRELGALYQQESGGAAAVLEPLPLDYTQYASWLYQRMNGAEGQRMQQYWTNQLRELPPFIDLPLDKPRPRIQTFDGDSLLIEIDSALTGRTQQFAKGSGISLFVTLLSAFYALLNRYSGQRELAVGSPTAGRLSADVAGIVGYFANPVVLRAEVNSQTTFEELLTHTQRTVSEALEHQEFPFPLLVEQLGVQRDGARSPLFQAALVYQKAVMAEEQAFGAVSLGMPGVRFRLGNLLVESLELKEKSSQFDLTFRVAEIDRRLFCSFLYNSDLFERETVERMARHYRNVLEQGIAAPRQPVSQIELLSPAEREQLLSAWARIQIPAHGDVTIHALVERKAREMPDAEAVVCGDARLSYSELNQRADCLAHRLAQENIGRGSRVAICFGRCAETVIAMLAALKTGAAYVPIDPEYPHERQEFMLLDSDAQILIQRAGGGKLGTLGVPTLNIDEFQKSDGGADEFKNESGGDRSGDLVWIIYTSGSTGKPKGVGIEQRGALALLNWAEDAFTQEEMSGVLASTSWCFDLSAFEIWAPLVRGGTIFIAENVLQLPSLAGRERVRLINSVPSAVQELLRQNGIPRSVETMNVAGEALTRTLVEKLQSLGHIKRVLNLYGPTEDTTYSTWAEIGTGETAPEIGRPIKGSAAYVLDEHSNPVPPGVLGELCLAGVGLARGYIGRPGLTAERFVPDPFSGRAGERLYRTGDRVRQRRNGELEYHGRADHQIKLRGFRIELGEIEVCLERYGGVSASAVAVRESPTGDPHLVAYVVWDASGTNTGSLSNFLQQHLPAYMVPAIFVELSELPRTANGKVNRRALPEPDWRAQAPDFVPPATQIEEAIAAIWKEVLVRERISTTEEFFSLGGHSLLATRIVSRLREAFVVGLSLREFFENATVAKLAKHIEKLRGTADASLLPPLIPQERPAELPLSFAQERIWFLEQLEPESRAYNVPAGLSIRGQFSVSAAQQSFKEIVRRHEALRTSFVVRNNVPTQSIRSSQVAPLPMVDLSGLDAVQQQAEFQKLSRLAALMSFDLQHGPLMRLHLLRLSNTEHTLLLNLHHIVSDGSSLGVLSHEFGEIYGTLVHGLPVNLPDLPVQYADYALWQRRHLQGELLAEHLHYWQGRLAGIVPLDLPTDHRRSVAPEPYGQISRFTLDAGLVKRLKHLSGRLDMTVFMTLLAGWQLLLSRYCRQSDVAVGSPIAGRTQKNSEGLIGCLVNTLVFRTDLEGDPRFEDVLQQGREFALQAYSHQELPFEKLVEELQPQRTIGRTPLFDSSFTLQNMPLELSAPGLVLKEIKVDFDRVKFDLALTLTESEEGMLAELAFREELFNRETIQRLGNHFRRVLEQIATNPDLKVSEITLISAEEQAQILAASIGKIKREYLQDCTIAELFEAQVAKTPQATALISGVTRLSYEELNRRANQLANCLLKRGVGPEAPIGIFMDRSEQMVITLLAVLKAGGAYLPVDAGYPQERIRYMFADAETRLVITEERLLQMLGSYSGVELICVEHIREELAGQPTSNPIRNLHPENLAYVIYTSGSTGKPKGTPVTHANVQRLLAATEEWFHFGHADTWTLFHSYAFDFSVWEIWGALLHGGRLVVVPYWVSRSPEEFWELLKREEVSVLNQTPSAFHQLIEADAKQGARKLDSLHLVILGGEALEIHSLKPWWDRYGDTRPELVNMYGITETTVHVTYKPLRQSELASSMRGSPIGIPIPDLQVYVLEPSGQLAPMGISGEMHVGGGGVARGYLKQPELSAEHFVPDPFSKHGSRLYRTGDLARQWESGELEYLGRIDQQVKIRGFRIELGEIESLLSAHSGVTGCAVVALGEGEKRYLAGYVVLNGGPSGATASELREYLRGKLPEYMVPAAIVELPALPLTSNGKLDRNALPKPKISDALEYVAPRTPTEEQIAVIWADVLGHDKVSVEANFFELGGHSLLATRVCSRLREILQIDLPLRAFFERPIISALAVQIERLRGANVEEETPPLVAQPRGATAPLSFSQERIWFLEQLEPDTSANNIPIGLRFRGALSQASLEQAIGVVALRHESLRTVFAEMDGRPVQRILSYRPMRVAVVDLSALSPVDAQQTRSELTAMEADAPFDLKRGPLFRSTLLRFGAAEHLLLLTMHHIISDGWSLGVFSRELTALYESFAGGNPSTLPALAIQYADYCYWQRQLIQDSVLEKHLSYWRKQLGEEPPVLELPADHPRPEIRTTRGANHVFTFPEELVSAAQRISAASGNTRFMILFSGFLAVLHRYSGESDLSVGTFIANRNQVEAENLIGFFVNNLALRVNVRGSHSFRQLLERVRDVTLGAYAHQDLPFEKILEDLRPDRSRKHTPFFQTMFVLQNTPRAEFQARNLQVNIVPIESRRANFDITLWVEEREGLSASLQYNADLFDAITIEQMARHLCCLLQAAVDDWERRISDLPMLAEAERMQILREWNNTAQAVDENIPIHVLFEQQVAHNPEATAILFKEEQVSYKELNKKANRIAHRLSTEAGPEDLIALMGERSPELIAGALGILKAGCGYVPIDPRVPDERLQYMLQDSGVRILLTQQHLAHRVSAGVQPIALDDAGEFEDCSTANLPCRIYGGNAAYVIYTSGSTGAPKSVLIEHHLLTNHTLAAVKHYAMTASDRVLQFASLSFDASAEEIYPCLLSGATLVLRTDAMLASPAYFLQACEQWTITVLNLPTAYWHALAEAMGRDIASLPASLRLTILGGERAIPERAFRWVNASAVNSRLVNTYGPTEATIVATHCDVTDLLWERVPAELPMGWPIANVQTYVLDDCMEPVPFGVTGQLHIGGAGLARQYLRRPELTAEKFVPNPFSSEPGKLIYKTGDYVRQMRDGHLEFVGRKDRQIKIRGNRIELSEIEARLVEYPGVQEAAVVPRKDPEGEPYLVAYLVSRLQPPPEMVDVRAFLKKKLPEYMVPILVVTIDRMPLTSAGKLDVAKFPVPSSARTDRSRDYVAPRTPTEEILAGIWSEVLRVPQPSMNDSFFDLGGYSLLATQVLARIREVFSVELPLNSLFESKTMGDLAAQIAAASRTPVPRIERVSRDAELPLSFAQERIWFLTQLDRKISSYHVPRATRATGNLNIVALRDSYSGMAQRHEILRTTFPTIEGRPVQRVHGASLVPIPVVDLSNIEGAEKENYLQQLILQAGQQLFDIEHGPLLRVRLLRLSEHEHVVVQTEHHLVHDGWAEGVLTRDLLAFYSAFTHGRPAELPPLPIQFADFAAWQRKWMQGEVLESQLAFWKKTLAGALPLLNLPTDHPRPALQTFKGAEEELRLPLPLVESLRDLSRCEGATLFMTACAAFLALLHRYSQQEDIVLGTVIANRSHQQTEGLLGMILNTLPLRTSMEGDPSFRMLLARVRQACLATYENQDVPFEKLVDAVRPERNLSYSPIFQVMFAFHDAPRPDMNLPGLRLQSIDAHNRSAKFDMLVISSTSAEGMTSLFEYNTDLFEAATIRRFVSQYSHLLGTLRESMDQRLSELRYMPQQELDCVIHEFNQTRSSFPQHLCLHQMFEAQAARTPEAMALETAATKLTYDALNRCANQLARQLQEKGIGHEERVAIYSGRSAEMIIAILGVLKAGAAYVPIDPAYPPKRQQFILKDSGACMLLAERGLLEKLPKGDVPCLLLNDFAVPEKEAVSSLPPVSTASSLAYLIYTSGSTGIPKGVAIEHRSAVTLVHWAREVFTPQEFAGTLASTSICFDLSIFEIFLPLSWGGKVLLVENILHLPAPWLKDKVTLVNTVPSGIAELIGTVGLPQSVTTVCLAGEPLRGELVKKIYAQKQVKRVFNLYGPSEATTYSTFAAIEATDPQEPSIGGPVANTQAYVLDVNLRPLPIGVPGEVFLGGAGIARGYLGRPELTARQFIPNPFGEPGSRLYRTGDLARWTATGALEFLGRIDHQVKIRGYRIEPGEIETALRSHEAIRDCAVIARRSSADELRLVAYLVAGRRTGERELREYLRSRLPDYMLPFAFVFMDALPLTPNGKLDRKALPAPENEAAAKAEMALPASQLEAAITSIWKEVLGRQDVGVRSNFFDLGGHSLLLMRIHHRIRTDLGFADLELIDLFKYPTIEAIARHLSGDARESRLAIAGAPQAGPVAEEDHAIAIIGMAGRFPGAADVRQFWSNLCAGVESISRFTVEELEAAGVEPEVLRQPGYVRAKGIIENIEWFDADFFDYSPREAEIMDPQQRLFLECAWEALEDAGYDPLRIQQRVGVYAGSGMSSYWLNLYTNPNIVKLVSAYQAKLGNDKDYLPTRVAYKLNLKGPAINVQTACSTSLVAVHLACRSLIQHECDMALAGGVSVVAQQKSGYLFHEGGIHSPDGMCRAFDAGAQGTVGGNGLGIVILKRLRDAQAEGDHIYAVIKGTALDNDGAEKVGYTAPSIRGQAQVIADAIAYAGVDAGSIEYIEAHGTATVLGDPIEVAALNEAFAPYSMPARSCAIGSVKTNVGHLDAAAGVTGLIKTALALKHRKIPPSLHYSQSNPKIDFDRGPFFVNRQLRDWEKASGLRRAGVSSFGIGGTNAHAVLEEAPAGESTSPSRPWQLLVLSARNASVLDRLTQNLQRFLKYNSEVPLVDVACTLQTGRHAFPHRRILVCRDREEALQILDGNNPELLFTEPPSWSKRSLVFLFPGAGTQRVNMGLELYRTEETFRKTIDECARLFLPYLNLDLRKILYPEDENIEAATEQLQGIALNCASVFALECALSLLWIEWEIRPSTMIGHSMGEYVAAWVAGVFSLEDAVRLVAARGNLMAKCPPGAMMSVAMEQSALSPLLDSRVCIAAINSESQCVVSGPPEAIDSLEQQLTEKNIMTNRLRADRAGHSAMLDPILEQFAEETRKVEYHAPRIPFISGVTGRWIQESEATDPDYWVRHLRQPVQFHAGLSELFQEQDRILLEVGPGRILAPLAQRHPQRPPHVAVLSSLRSPAQRPEAASQLEALGRLWLHGVTPDWNSFYKNERRARISLPTYPFERQYYWIKPGSLAQPATAQPAAKKNEIADWFYVRSWKRSAPPVEAEGEALQWLLFVDDSELSRMLAQGLEGRAHRLVKVEAGPEFTRFNDRHYAIRPQCTEDYQRLIHQLKQDGRIPQRVVHAWNLGPSVRYTAEQSSFDAVYSLLYLAQCVSESLPAAPLQLDVLSSGTHAVHQNDQVIPERAAILGACRVIPQELSHIVCRHINVDLQHASERLAISVLRELLSSPDERSVAWRGHTRWTENFEPIRIPDKSLGLALLRPKGTYLILGGLGRIGLTLARFLAKEFQARLALVQRSPLGGVNANDVMQNIRELEDAGGKIIVISADVANESEMRKAISQTVESFGALHGVIHAAGIVGEQAHRAVEETGPEQMELHFRAKVHGVRVLEKVLQGMDIDFCMLQSSLSSILGGLGYYAYACANAFMDAFAQQSPHSRSGRWMGLNWDAWSHRNETPSIDGLGATLAQLAITAEEGVEAFQHALSVIDIPQVLVSTSNLQQRLQSWVIKAKAVTAETVIQPAHARPAVRTHYVAPRNEMETSVAEVLQQLLGIEHVGIDDNFFELGGDSLLATQAAARLRQKFNVNFQLRTFMENPTISTFAEALQEKTSQAQPVPQLQADFLQASLTIDQELEELRNLSDDEVKVLIEAKASSSN
jgi:amino acid adenylation domain-containing protein